MLTSVGNCRNVYLLVSIFRLAKKVPTGAFWSGDQIVKLHAKLVLDMPLSNNNSSKRKIIFHSCMYKLLCHNFIEVQHALKESILDLSY